jgi:hypothetical protein
MASSPATVRMTDRSEQRNNAIALLDQLSADSSDSIGFRPSKWLSDYPILIRYNHQNLP